MPPVCPEAKYRCSARFLTMASHAPRRALTRAMIEQALKAGAPAGQELVLNDSMPGLALRIRGNVGSWSFRYRPRGAGRSEQPRRVTLGRFPALSPEDARQAAKKFTGEIASGADPAIAIKAEKRRAKHALASCLDDYERHILKRGLTGVGAIMSSLRRGLAVLAGEDIAAVTRKQVVDCIEAVEAAGKPGAALYLRRHVRTFLERELERGTIPFNPMAGLRRPRKSRVEQLAKQRTGRALSDDELVAVWRAAQELGPFGSLLRFCMLTGARRNEAATLLWSDVVADESDAGRDDGKHSLKIVLPAERTKNGREHQIPVVGLLEDLLTSTPKQRGSDYVFGSMRSRGPLAGWTQLLRRAHAASGTKDWTIHDLRRSFRSKLTDLGVAFETAEACIAHAPAELTQVYDRSAQWAQRKAATQAFSLWLQGALKKGGDASNVVQLPSKKVV